MPKPKNLIPSVNLTVALPQDIEARLRLHLYSELEGRVPQGKHQEFFVERIREFFASRTLDLAAFTATDPGVHIVRGAPATILVLEATLKGVTSL